MKAIIYICVAGMITGCASDQASVSRWNDMWVDIALRHKYEKYSCARALEGYSKDPPAFSHRKGVTLAREQVLVKAPGADLEAGKQRAQRAARLARIREARTQCRECHQTPYLLCAGPAGHHYEDLVAAEDSIRALSAKIDVLEDALKTNAATTNQNQDLLVQQINALKAQLAQLQQPSSRMPEK